MEKKVKEQWESLKTLPMYARAYFVTQEMRNEPTLTKRIATLEKRKGQLVSELPEKWKTIIGTWAGLHAWHGCDDNRMVRDIGVISFPPQVRTKGSNSNWRKRSTFRRYIDFAVIVPKTRKQPQVWEPTGVGTAVVVGPTTKAVLRYTRNLYRIGNGTVSYLAITTELPKLPIHSQRRMVQALTDLPIRYEREKSVFVLTDSHGEEYHFPATIRNTDHARRAVQFATDAFRSRQQQKRQTERNARLDAIIASQPVWVSYEDSRTAGNCAYGTAEFRRRMEEHLHAQGELGAVLATEILAVRKDDYTLRACRVAAAREVRA